MSAHDRMSEQPLPTHEQTQQAYREGMQAEVGSANPYAGVRVLASVWAAGRDWQRRQAFADLQGRESARRRNA
ncbi:hypothetical protein SEA_ASHERTHEMAN_16 [Gordonia phage Ashertheman]|uniref:Uncharacterized protein n=1 Tax=Gordonia phage Ashertheman TaxID=2301692 RepID=A0A385DTY4_9CAUD|nr:hypothetical protein J1764_gp16 [Gordonia phage Ashertheman]AXQ62923.1 hypothetical protein SEA_ASHERTHEMAN_16 [Gordonia phage Ashertheman]